MADKKTATAKNNDLRVKVFGELSDLLTGLDAVQTDTTSLTVPCVREDGVEMFYTVKLTLHKEDFDLDEKVTDYEMKVAEREKKAAEQAKKKADVAAKKADKDAKKTAKSSEGEVTADKGETVEDAAE